MNEPIFPRVVDNSQRSQFVACPRKWYWSTIRGLVSATPNIHLHAGGAFAKGLEASRRAFHDGKLAPEDAVTEGMRALIAAYGETVPNDDSTKSLDRMTGALVSYFDMYPLDRDILQPARMPDGTLAVEFSGIVELPIRHPETGDPLLYGGRFDMLAIRDGVLFVEDDKTTSQLGATWSKRWDLNAQMTGYCHIAAQYGFPVAGAIIRGVSILKTQYGHAQAIVYRPQWQIDRWWQQLICDVTRMVDAFKWSHYDYDLADACSAYGGCNFMRLCTVADPEPWIETEYRVEPHRPYEGAGE